VSLAPADPGAADAGSKGVVASVVVVAAPVVVVEGVATGLAEAVGEPAVPSAGAVEDDAVAEGSADAVVGVGVGVGGKPAGCVGPVEGFTVGVVEAWLPPPWSAPWWPPLPPLAVGAVVGVGALEGVGVLACTAGLRFGAFLEPVCQAKPT
jgi:hypothetical protein